MFTLEKYFYPLQLVQANAAHKMSEENSTVTNIELKHAPVSTDPNKYVIEVILSVDKEESINYPYDFNLHVFGLFNLPEDSKNDLNTIRLEATKILIGCLRERLNILTQGGPWPAVALNVQAIDPNIFNNSEEETSKSDSE